MWAGTAVQSGDGEWWAWLQGTGGGGTGCAVPCLRGTAAATHDEEHLEPQLHPTAPPDPLLLHCPAGGINAGYPMRRSCTSPIGTPMLWAPTFTFLGSQPMWGGGRNAA